MYGVQNLFLHTRKNYYIVWPYWNGFVMIKAMGTSWSEEISLYFPIYKD